MDMYKRAVIRKFRFPSVVGIIALEDLFDLPLTSKNRASLDDTARRVFTELKQLEEGSFVDATPNPRRTELQYQLELVKDVIADRVAANAQAEKQFAAAQKKQKLLTALAAKEDSELAGKSREELEAEIRALDAA